MFYYEYLERLIDILLFVDKRMPDTLFHIAKIHKTKYSKCKTQIPTDGVT